MSAILEAEDRISTGSFQLLSVDQILAVRAGAGRPGGRLSRYHLPPLQSFLQWPRRSGFGLLSSWKLPIPLARAVRHSCVPAQGVRQYQE